MAKTSRIKHIPKIMQRMDTPMKFDMVAFISGADGVEKQSVAC